MIKDIIMILVLVAGMVCISRFYERSTIKKYLFAMFLFWIIVNSINLLMSVMVILLNDSQIYIEPRLFGSINSILALVIKIFEGLAVYCIYLIVKLLQTDEVDVELP